MDDQIIIQNGKRSSRFFFLALLLFITLFGGVKEAIGQTLTRDFLLLKRGPQEKKQIRFFIGESITYKSKKLGYFVTDKIVRLDLDYIYLTENILKPEDILEIDIRNKDPRNYTLRNLTSLFLGSGALLLGVESINSIYQQNEFGIDSGVGLTAGILIGTGLAILPIRYKIFKNEGKNRIQILLLSPE